MRTWMIARDLEKDWNGRTLFEKVNMEVTEGERLALFGRNGCGKTTLLRILAGMEESTGGSVERLLPLEEWGMMKQHEEIPAEVTALERAYRENGELYALKQRLDALTREMSGTGSEAQQALEAYGPALEAYEALGGFDWENEVEKQLQRIGLPQETWNLPYASLSGGQKTRVRLAALLARSSKLLILDEPTNHLDEESLHWLEEQLKAYAGTLLFVSHDRQFIDEVATAVCELNPDGIQKYRGGYTDYKGHKERELREHEALHKKQEQQRKALEESIRNYQQWFKQAHNAATHQSEVKITQSYYKAKAKKNISRYHAKQKQLERLDAESVGSVRQAPQLKMSLEDEGFEARTLLRFEHVHFAYGPCVIVKDAHFQLDRGDRLAVRGPNGSGKTTLLRLATEKLAPSSGKVKLHSGVKIGYFSQELEGLPLEQSLLDSLLELPNMTQTEARTLLGCFLFSREDVFKKISDLSMGEKCRAAFIRLYFGGANLLVLDEPNNHLDIDTREVMENALMRYQGALLLVSHDRMLVRKAANRIAELDGEGGFELFEGTLAEREESRRLREEHPGGREENERRLMLELKLSELMRGEGESGSISGSHDKKENDADKAGHKKKENAAWPGTFSAEVMDEIREVKRELAELKHPGS
ncbi:ribosomal protection-like ABC-F family protein [Saccharibacillus kuerlensis]|uniref:ABC transporter ATP-binding protein n=1 Tax=Saccharibacillus kuerlensis TaxID=459527 RepID=A0ABQ2KSW5_9BACL|nr:ABC-F type ribosomal protection protein [Saccharibacillus kuerlensis]GGN92389.1 ABC transporter ATP-binding protein [Saccharibacillus kuerlensis]